MKEIQIITLLCFGLTAMLTDVRSGRIPNGLIFTGLVCGLTYQWMKYGMSGLLLFMGGCLLPLLLLGILFYFRMTGAGDIKLFGVIGGFVGPESCLECMILAILFGGIISLVLMVRRRNMGQRLSYLGEYISCWTECRTWKSYIEGVKEDGKFCFSIPVFLSLLCYAGEYISSKGL